MLNCLPTHHQILVKGITYFVSHTCGPFRSRNISCKQFRLGPQYMSYMNIYINVQKIICRILC